MSKPSTIVTGGIAGIIAAGTAGTTVGNAGIIAAGIAGTMVTGITAAHTTGIAHTIEPGMTLTVTAGAGSIYSSDTITSPGAQTPGLFTIANKRKCDQNDRVLFAMYNLECPPEALEATLL
jgi:hypothetical protein